MRKVKIILAWIAVSLILQCSVLFFLDKFYFKDNTDVSMEKVSINSNNKKENIHVNIPSDAKDIKVSYDGKYISYYMGYELNICDTESGDVKQLETINGGNILKSVWLEDRNMLLTLEIEDNQIVLCNYDPEKNTNEKIVDICQYSKIYKTFNIKASTITWVTYIQVGNMIYRIDINQTAAVQVPIIVRNIGQIGLMPTKDRLVYIATNGTIVHITQPNERIQINTSSKLKILGIDEEGVLYLGEVTNNKVHKILKKDLDNDESAIKKVPLKEPVEDKNIFIDGTGAVFVNNSEAKTITDINTQKQITYKGNFLGFYNNGIASIVDGKYYTTEYPK